MMSDGKRLALVTGGSRGIGFELAKCAARDGHDLIIVARDRERLETAAGILRELGAAVEVVVADLSDIAEVDRLATELRGRPVDLLCANAGSGLGGAFLDRSFPEHRHVIDTNVTGTVALIHHVGRAMRRQGFGRILITGSIAGMMPAPFNAVYHATKAFIDNFAASIRNEFADYGVNVTCLMPGATATEFFAAADMLDAKVADMATADPADVARVGYEAVMRGDAEVIHGLKNKLAVKAAGLASSQSMARQSRKENQPGSRA